MSRPYKKPIRYDWAEFDAAYAALATPIPHGAVTNLARRFGIPASTVFYHLQHRRCPPIPAEARYPLLADLLFQALDGAAWSADKWVRWRLAVKGLVDFYIEPLKEQ